MIPGKLSVVMTVYNGAPYLHDSIGSVLAQSYRNLELIVVDDRSTDDSCQIVQSFAANDPRVRLLVRDIHAGRPAPGKNQGLAEASGEFVAFIDHDDVYLPHRFDGAIAALERHPDWVATFSDIAVVDEHRRHHPGSYLQTMAFRERASGFLKQVDEEWFECSDRFHVFQSLYFAAVHTLSVTIARARLPASSMTFDTSYGIVDDIDLWMRIARHGVLGYQDRILGEYRQHSSNITRDRSKTLRDQAALHAGTYATITARLTPVERRTYRRKISQIFTDLGYQSVRVGRISAARSAFLRALRWRAGSAQVQALAKSYLPWRVRKGVLRLMGRPEDGTR